jgi:lipopolysaccharide export LptBFGC system permease protein LptF
MTVGNFLAPNNVFKLHLIVCVQLSKHFLCSEKERFILLLPFTEKRFSSPHLKFVFAFISFCSFTLHPRIKRQYNMAIIIFISNFSRKLWNSPHFTSVKGCSF